MRCLALSTLEEEPGPLHVLRTHWLALPRVRIPVGVGDSEEHVCGAQGKDLPSSVGPYPANGLLGGMHPPGEVLGSAWDHG